MQALRSEDPRSQLVQRVERAYRDGYVQAPCQVRASLGRDGIAFVRSARTDIGTVMTQSRPRR